MGETDSRGEAVVGDDAALDEFLADLEFQGSEHSARNHHVTAVIVSHEGGPWISQMLTALADQTRQPDAFVAVASGSGSDELRSALGGSRVLMAEPGAGFGSSVAKARGTLGDSGQGHPGGSADPEPIRWLWLLHDDAAAAPDALGELLLAADRRPEIGILGPKILGWRDPRLLLGVGMSISASGRLITGLVPHEFDAGQHDGDREVLAVESAGMLIRLDVWDALRGFDPDLPLFRDDVGLCLRAHRAGSGVLVATSATVRHRRAGAHARRPLAVGDQSPAQLAREAEGYVALVHGRAWTLPWRVLVFIAACLGRGLTLALGRDGQALDEVRALIGVLAHPGRVRRGRALVRETTIYPASHVRHLRARPGAQFVEARQARRAAPAADAPGQATSVESAFDPDAALELDERSWLERQSRRPISVMLIALLGLAVLAGWGLWRGEGVLRGGALLPVPELAADLWGSYLDGWWDVSLGSDAAAWPYLVPLGLLGTLLMSADRAVTAVLLLAVPAAAASAYINSRTWIPRAAPRAFLSVTYAVAPAAISAGATGRIGTAAFAVMLPIVARQTVLLAKRPDEAFRRVWILGLFMAIAAAFVPASLIINAVVLLALVIRRALRPALGLLGVVVPAVLLLPWSWDVVRNPDLLLLEPGLTSRELIDPGLHPWDVLTANPGGPAVPAAWAGGLLLLLGLAASARRSRLIMYALLAALLGVLWGWVYIVVPVTPPTVGLATTGWPGPATLLVAGGLLTACARWYSEARPQGMARAVSAGAALAVSLLWVSTWALLDEGRLVTRTDASVVPAVASAEAESSDRVRTLILRRGDDGRTAFALANDRLTPIGSGELPIPPDAQAALNRVVEDLAAARADDEADRLAQMAVRYIVVPDGNDLALVRALDSEPGLRRIASGTELLWRVSGSSSRARIQTLEGGGVVEESLPAGERGVSSDIPQASAGTVRRVVLAVSHAPGWRATVDGEPVPSARVPAAADGWSVAFALPDSGGRLEVWYDTRWRIGSVLAQSASWLAVALLALPRRRHEEDPEESPLVADRIVAELPMREGVRLG